MSTNIVLVEFEPLGAPTPIQLQVTGKYSSALRRNQFPGRVDGGEAKSSPRGTRYPKGWGRELASREFTVNHVVNSTLAAQGDALQSLEGDIYSYHHQPGVLRFYEDDVLKEAECMPKRVELAGENEGGCNDTGLYDGTWELFSGVFHAAGDPEVYDGTGPGSISVTNAGKIKSERVVIDFLPTVQKATEDGQQHLQYITLANISPDEMIDQPTMLTQGFDHAAVVAGGGDSGGFDVELYDDQRRVPRWVCKNGTYGWGTTDCRLWGLVTAPPARSWVLAKNVSAADLTAQINLPAYDLPSFPFYAILQAAGGNEVVRVTGYDQARRTLTWERHQRDSTAYSALAGVRLWWATGLYELVHGWDTPPVPTYIDDRLKPIALESTATIDNTGWTFDRFYESAVSGDLAALLPRAGGWLWEDAGERDRERETGDGDQFWQYVGKLPGTPGARVGLAYSKDGAKTGRPIIDRWTFRTPWKITNVTGGTYDATTLGLFGPGSGQFWEAWFRVEYEDADGNVIFVSEHDQTSGALAFTPSGGAKKLILRVKPWDPQAVYADAWANVSAERPGEGDGWEAYGIRVSFSDTPLVVFPGTVHDVYQIGRPDDPATITNALGEELAIAGVLVPLDVSPARLRIVVETETDTLGDGRGAGHRLLGTRPGAPPGTSNLVYAETGGDSVDFEVSVTAAWN